MGVNSSYEKLVNRASFPGHSRGTGRIVHVEDAETKTRPPARANRPIEPEAGDRREPASG